MTIICALLDLLVAILVTTITSLYDLTIYSYSLVNQWNPLMTCKLSEGKAKWSSEIRAIMNANGFDDKFISKLQCNLEIVR